MATPTTPTLVEIRSRHGGVVWRSKNLRGLTVCARKLAVETVSIACNYLSGRGDAFLSVVFIGGATCTVPFASFAVLLAYVRRWRTAYGALLEVDGIPRGRVSYHNAALGGCGKWTRHGRSFYIDGADTPAFTLQIRINPTNSQCGIDPKTMDEIAARVGKMLGAKEWKP